jgi:hypothetical protein
MLIVPQINKNSVSYETFSFFQYRTAGTSHESDKSIYKFLIFFLQVHNIGLSTFRFSKDSFLRSFLPARIIQLNSIQSTYSYVLLTQEPKGKLTLRAIYSVI